MSHDRGSLDDPNVFPDDDDCPNCGGLGIVPGCFEDCCSGADCDPEDAEMCCCPQTCDWCKPRKPVRA